MFSGLKKALGKTNKCAGQEARRLRIQALLAHLQTERFLEPPPAYEELDGMADAIKRDAAHAEAKLELLQLSPKGMAASLRSCIASRPAGSPKSPLAASSTEKAGSSSRTKVGAGATLQALQVRGAGGTSAACCDFGCQALWVRVYA